ncbi:major facilitator superfamily domain-containing protein [Zopfochytrium polystomum]|nr:major facilitator superfamily domain-containing protein [Zopfochytrium polystomum]
MGDSNSNRSRSTSQANDKFVNKCLRVIFIALLIDILAFTIILPLFPRILEHYDRVDGANESSAYYQMLSIVRKFKESIGATGSRMDIVIFGGLLGSLFSFLQFVSSPFIGSLSDRYGRKNVLLISMIGNAVSMGLWIVSKSFLVFVLSRVVGGLTEGNVQMSIAMISDITTRETRSRGLALVGIAFSIGFTVGPPLGAYFASVDLIKVFPALEGWPINSYSSPALFAFVLIVIESIYMAIALPETLNFKKKRHSVAPAKSLATSDPSASDAGDSTLRKRSTKKDQGASKESANATTPVAIPTATPNQLSLLHFLFLFFFSGMEFTLTFLTHDRFQFTHVQQGKYLAMLGILSACVQGGYVRRFAHKLVAERDIVVQGMISCAMGLGCIGLLAVPPAQYTGQPIGAAWLYVGGMCLGFTSGTVVTTLTSLASLATGLRKPAGPDHDEDEEIDEGSDRGRVLGTFRSLGQLGRSLGPLAACSAYWLLGSKIAYGVSAVLILLLSVYSDAILPFVPPTGRVLPAKKKN